MSDQAKRISEGLSQIMNVIGRGRTMHEAARLASEDHPTLQQNMMRFCMEFIYCMSEKDCGVDGRNQASHNMAKTVISAVKGDIYLPFV